MLALALGCHCDVAFYKIVGEFLLKYYLSKYQNLHIKYSNSKLSVLLLLSFLMCFKILPRFGSRKIAKIKFLSKGN